MHLLRRTPVFGSSAKEISHGNVSKIFSRSRAGTGHFEKSDPDPDKNRPDPQHLYRKASKNCNDNWQYC
jgi:hypothetical protein